MKKTVLVFKGFVNGVEFDNVAAYNEAITKAIGAGTLQSASSTTEVAESEDTAATTCSCGPHCDDEDLTMYPYMSDDDPYYLDLLVTDNPETNLEAKMEVKNQFSKCAKYIKEVLNSDIEEDVRRKYLKDINDILHDLDRDEASRKEAEAKIAAKRETLNRSLDEYKRKVERELEDLEKKQFILDASADIIKMFKEFYLTINVDTQTSINEKTKKVCACNGNCTCNAYNVEDGPLTTITETEPQQEIRLSDVPKSIQHAQSLISAIFGDLTKRRLS